MRLEIGQIYGDKYRILRRIGEGAMGAVYEGENVRIHRRVAIKTLHGGVASKADVITRFEREAQAAGRIGSEHIVEVLDMGELEDGTRFMVMEFLEGVTLAKRIRSKGRLSPDEACTFLIELLDGLAGAHQAGIIHRDLKPANVFLLHSKNGRADFVKILDFGVSKFSLLGGEEMAMTSTGAVLGTPFYMSPEQAKGSAGIDHRSDLYTVGVIAYECVTGQVPYAAETFNELLFKIVLESPPPAESFVPDLDPAFAAILRKAMSREPGDRYQTAAELSRAFEQFQARPKGAGGAPLPGQAQPRPAPPQAPTPPPAPVGPNGPPPTPQVVARPAGFGGAAGGRPPPPRPAAGMPAAPVGMSGTMAMPDGVPGLAAAQAPTVRPGGQGAPPPPPQAAAPLPTPPPAQAGYGYPGQQATMALQTGPTLQGGFPGPATPPPYTPGMVPQGAPGTFPQGSPPFPGAQPPMGPQGGMPPTPAPPGAAWGDPGQAPSELADAGDIPGVSGGNRKIGVVVVLMAAVLLGGGTAVVVRWKSTQSGSAAAVASASASAAVAAANASAAAAAASASAAAAAASASSVAATAAAASTAPAATASASAAPSASASPAPTSPPAPGPVAVSGPKPGPRPTPAPPTATPTATPAPKSTGTTPSTKGRTISSEL